MPETSMLHSINTVGDLDFKGLTNRVAIFSKEAEHSCAQIEKLHKRCEALVKTQKQFNEGINGSDANETRDTYAELEKQLAECKRELRELQAELLISRGTPIFSKSQAVQPIFGQGGEVATDMLSSASGAAGLAALFSTATPVIGGAATVAALGTLLQQSSEEQDAGFAMVVAREFGRVTENSNQEMVQSIATVITEAMASGDMGSVVADYLSLTTELHQQTREWDKQVGLEYMERRIPGLEEEKIFDKDYGDRLAAAKGISAGLMADLENEKSKKRQEAYQDLFDKDPAYSTMLQTASNPEMPDKERWAAEAAIARMQKEADALAEQRFKASEVYQAVYGSEMLLIDNMQRMYEDGSWKIGEYGIAKNLGEGINASHFGGSMLPSAHDFAMSMDYLPPKEWGKTSPSAHDSAWSMDYPPPKEWGRPWPNALGFAQSMDYPPTQELERPWQKTPDFAWSLDAMSQKFSDQSFVPYDNFPALLHQGERVLTASEARAANGGGTAPITITGNTFTVREEADIERIAEELAVQLEKARAVYAP